MNYGFVRVAAITPKMRVADVEYNAERIVEKVAECAEKGVQLAVFPELALCGATCADLLLQPLLVDACMQSLKCVVKATEKYPTLCFVGLPLVVEGKLYNVAAAFSQGKILAFIPKRKLLNYGEFSESRYFSVLTEEGNAFVCIDGEKVYFGNKVLLQAEDKPEFSVGVTVGNFIFDSVTNITVHLAAESEGAGKQEQRAEFVKTASAAGVCAYIYAAAGVGESTTDLLFAGHNLIAEKGKIIAESALFEEENIIISEVDLEKIAFERKKVKADANLNGYRTAFFSTRAFDGNLIRKISPTPFIPQNEKILQSRAELILNIQSHALARRLRHTNANCAVIGVSGGLDSTLALLVAARAFDILKKDKKNIIAITMPGFGTTGKTKSNALKLIECIGATPRKISIAKSVLQHFKDIGHDQEKLDVTYENAQARMRTLILMDVANKEGGLVIGTGDLSELALGWCTYNGDHMSMYAVNASVPKTLIKHLVFAVGNQAGGTLKKVLDAILNTDISPELLPPDKEGNITQKTEDLVGPYELHDFFLYYAIRWGFAPQKILYLALNAFAGKYDKDIILQWLKNFYRRIFTQQFKRSCSPDGVKVGSLSLSPRGDWRMPSDAQGVLWLKELEN